jgi:tetratricopeptide (TPR) repeat protein
MGLVQARSFVRPALVILGGLLLGWLVLAATMDRIFARSAPALALFWNPGSADANVWFAQSLLQDPDKGARNVIKEHATRSLGRQPVNSGAASLLGITAAEKGDERRAERLVAYAETMSRRDLTTQLWLIESNVAKGNVAAALIHYDRALKSNNTARTLLFPILGQAANNPAVWRPLVPILAARPQWGRSFIQQYIPVSTAPDALYAIARALGMDRVPSTDPWVLQGIEKRLVDLFAYSQAAELYNRANGLPANDRSTLRNGGFEQPGDYDPFDWNLVDDQDLAAQRQPSPVSGDGSALFLSATNGRGGDLAVQLTMLAPGRYAITAKVGGVHGDPLAFPQLAVQFARDGRLLLNTPFPPAPDGGRAWRTEVTVPAGCPAQRIVLRGSSTLDAQPASPWIDSVAIRRQEGQ